MLVVVVDRWFFVGNVWRPQWWGRGVGRAVVGSRRPAWIIPFKGLKASTITPFGRVELAGVHAVVGVSTPGAYAWGWGWKNESVAPEPS